MTYAGRRPSLEEIRRIVDEQRGAFADDPNVHSIGWGLPSRGGRLADEIAITFYVRRKLRTEAEIRAYGSLPIPREIEGLPTDVEDVTMRRASSATGLRDEKIENPLTGGVASSNAANHLWTGNFYGTLGMHARDADLRPLAMSNWHVWADGGEEGDNIIQPGHPVAVDHVAAIGEVLACGPVGAAVLNTQVPSPLTAGLYAGAAAAAAAAGASDSIDPTRRGQAATPVEDGEHTELETVDLELDYPDLPWPGTPFRVHPRWTYTRQTDRRLLVHKVEEDKLNPHFLIAYAVETDKLVYDAGEMVRVRAMIWYHEQFACDAFHVGLHLIPQSTPHRSERQLLLPAECTSEFMGRLFPSGNLCTRFAGLPPGRTGKRSIRVDWLAVTSLFDDEILAVPIGGGAVLSVPASGLRLRFHPAGRVTVRVDEARGEVVLRAIDPFGREAAMTTAGPGTNLELSLDAEFVTAAEITCEGGGCLLGEVCIDPLPASDSLAVRVDPDIGKLLGAEGSSVDCITNSPSDEVCFLSIRRCCFERSYQIPSTERPDRWQGTLVVQSVNNVPDGTDPVVAASTIGGHILTPSAEVIGCAVVSIIDTEYDST